MTDAPGKHFLRVTGILLIIGAVFSIVASILMLKSGDVAATNAIATDEFVSEAENTYKTILTKSQSAFCGVAIFGAILNLLCGITGIAGCSQPQIASKCFAFGTIMVVISGVLLTLSLLSGFTLSSALLPDSPAFSVVSGLCGLVVPIFYTIGASVNRKAFCKSQEAA